MEQPTRCEIYKLLLGVCVFFVPVSCTFSKSPVTGYIHIADNINKIALSAFTRNHVLRNSNFGIKLFLPTKYKYVVCMLTFNLKPGSRNVRKQFAMLLIGLNLYIYPTDSCRIISFSLFCCISCAFATNNSKARYLNV